MDAKWIKEDALPEPDDRITIITEIVGLDVSNVPYDVIKKWFEG